MNCPRTTFAVLSLTIASVSACTVQGPRAQDENSAAVKKIAGMEDQVNQLEGRLNEAESRHSSKIFGAHLLGEIELQDGMLLCRPFIFFEPREASVVRIAVDRATAEADCLNSLEPISDEECNAFCRGGVTPCVGSVRTAGEFDSYTREVIAEIPVGPEIPVQTLEGPTGVTFETTREEVRIIAHGVKCSGNSYCTCSPGS